MNLGVYLVTDPMLCGARGVAETVRAAVDGGVRTVQLRDKTADEATLLREVERLADVIAGRALLLVNDRLDVVVEARRRGIPVDGVHVGQSDEAVTRARDLLGETAVVGLSANTHEHLAAVAALPTSTVDYLGIGAIHATATKPDHPPALRHVGFARVAAATPLPSVAIGGVGLADVARLRQAGAAGVAVVSAICAADDPEQAARELVAAWNEADQTHPVDAHSHHGDAPGSLR